MAYRPSSRRGASRSRIRSRVTSVRRVSRRTVRVASRVRRSTRCASAPRQQTVRIVVEQQPQTAAFARDAQTGALLGPAPAPQRAKL